MHAERHLSELARVKAGDAPRPRRIRDVDSADRALRLRALVWAFVGSLPFQLIASHIGAGTRAPLLVTAVLSLSIFAIMYLLSLHIGEWLGRSAASVYFSAGASTAGRPEYSLADSLIVRGRLADATEELERAAALYPADPEPAIRLARLLRDHCSRPEDAIGWFRTALGRSAGDAGVEIAATREIIEIYTHVLRTPPRALPHLARLASRHADLPAGAWALGEIVEIKRAMQEEERS